jgi:hypothetical protein
MTEQQASSEQPLAVDIDALLGQQFTAAFFRDPSHTLQMNQSNSCSSFSFCSKHVDLQRLLLRPLPEIYPNISLWKCGCPQDILAQLSPLHPLVSWKCMIVSPVLWAKC